MIDERELFERTAERFDPPTDAFDRFTLRRDRARRRQRIGAAVVAMVVIAAVIAGFAVVTGRPQVEPIAPPTPVGFTDDPSGWIAVGGSVSIRAVNPADPSQVIGLSATGGAPLAWSSDGRALLVLRDGNLVVIRDDGAEIQLTNDGPRSEPAGGSFTPDGSAVVYEDRWSILESPLDGSPTRTIAHGNPSGSRGYLLPFSRGGQVSPSGLLAYRSIEMGTDGGIWVMDAADGTQQHQLIADAAFDGVFGDVGLEGVMPESWSPDGTKLLVTAVSNKLRSGSVECATFVIGADGSGLSRVTPEGMCLWSTTFSPDGSRITGNDESRIVTMNLDGSDVRTVLALRDSQDQLALNTAWNPVPSEGSS